MRKLNSKLLLLFTVLLISFISLELTKTTQYTEDYLIKIKAAEIMNNCMNYIYNVKLTNNYSIDMDADINNTGMIGINFSPITTTLGNLEAKRTGTNPNMAAVVIDMLNEIGIEKGNTVALNFSGSFPSLNIAALSAIEAMELNCIAISSIGSSTYGANIPELTYLDMENILYEKQIISNKCTYFSTGGIRDIGKEMDITIKNNIIDRLKSYGYKFLYNDTIEENILHRYNLYNKNNNIKCFINVGGNVASFGNSSIMSEVKGGIITNLPQKKNETGLIQLFLKDNVPVIHLLDIKDIAVKNGLPIDPKPLPEIGQGDVYYDVVYNKYIAIVFLILCIYILFLHKKTS